MANRYWVGGTSTWNSVVGSKWSTTDGGAGGAAAPTAADDVFFTAASGAVSVTVAATVNCANLTFTGFTGTLAGTNTILIYGSLVIVAGMTITHTGTLYFSSTSGSYTVTTNGKSIPSRMIFGFSPSTSTWTLQDALTNTNANGVTVENGTFTTNNYAVTVVSLNSSNSNTRAINLGSSTVATSATVGINFGVAGAASGLTFTAGTSSISLSATSGYVAGGSKDFYDISYTNTAGATFGIEAINSANNITIAGRASAGVTQVSVIGDTTINGTFTLSAGTTAVGRTFVRSSTIGTTRTFTCAAVASLTDIDFRDITIAGAAAPVSGTRLGDCKGNSGITFDAAKTVYWSTSASASWGISSGTSWTLVPGTGGATVNFPLAQDTAVFPSGFPNSGSTITINAAYNIGTLDMSARTANTMTLATGSNAPAIYGNWINGTGTTLTGTSTMTFAGRGSQTITSAGKTFTQALSVNSPSGSVTFQDAYTSSAAIALVAGTLSAATYNVSTSGQLNISGTSTRTLAFGSGTWSLTGSAAIISTTTTTNLTVTGTGTISATSASAKTFAGGGIQTYPTINQGGTGTLTITGSNKFANITNTAIGRVQFTGGTTNEFTAFNLNGTSTAARLALGSTNTTQVTLKAPSWNVGTGSLDSGNNTGLSFTAGTVDFLDISYVIGVVVGAAYVITANNGTYTVTGQSATLLRSKALVADNGYYNVTGYPATIVVGGSPIIVTDQLLIKLRSFTETRRF